MFDWWIRNNDRHLTPRGGNVNLLWQPGRLARNDDYEKVAEGGVAVIDHNLALDMEFSADAFCQTHVFAADMPGTFSDFLLRQTFIERLQVALAGCNKTWDTVSTAWNFVDTEQTVPSNYPIAEVRAMLNLIESADFWNLPR